MHRIPIVEGGIFSRDFFVNQNAMWHFVHALENLDLTDIVEPRAVAVISVGDRGLEATRWLEFLSFFDVA